MAARLTRVSESFSNPRTRPLIPLNITRSCRPHPRSGEMRSSFLSDRPQRPLSYRPSGIHQACAEDTRNLGRQQDRGLSAELAQRTFLLEVVIGHPGRLLSRETAGLFGRQGVPPIDATLTADTTKRRNAFISLPPIR